MDQTEGVSHLYPIKRLSIPKSGKCSDFLSQKLVPQAPLFFRFNRRPISQAGRRGFDPRLPLFPFNKLETALHGVTAKLPH